ncbi:MAG: alpha-glucan family phosphorylase, partial [Thiogranum sp.]|nr:alpha-glucan family phosphorylase [Thiogranum sp.]
MQIVHYLPRTLPDALQPLASLALDLRWSWHHGTDDLWRAVAPELWEATENPWLILETVSDRRLAELAADQRFLDKLQQQLAVSEEHYRDEDWFPSQYGSRFSGHIAYFSMEFGLSESLPIYSGGLGVLAGDCLKTACDLDVPLVGVGLLYHQGYFRQALNARGEQLEFYPFNDPTMLPVLPLRDEQGEWIRISIELPGRALRLRTWRAQVGRRALLLLDSNDLLNGANDRAITSELYGGGPEMRLQQEMVLGIGGWRLLERLGIECPVCHLNEGHAAFAILERARQFMMRSGQPFDVALRATRAGNLFTTHTPVEAGFDRFAPDLFSAYFSDYAQALGVTVDELLALGRTGTGADEPFNMAYLAVRGAGAVNGVSRLHGEVSRRILQPLFPRWPRSEVPVGHVTNGVHVPSWDSPAADALWTGACGKSRWRGGLESLEIELCKMDDEAFWQLRSDSRRRLVQFVRKRLARRHHGSGGADPIGAPVDVLDPDVLTLGFARRFAEYKRTNLLLHDTQRLLRLLCDRDRPVQLLIAGKAHPRDETGKAMLHQWQTFLERAEVRGRVVFIEDYDLIVAEQLVQGVDVWINTPRRPWEASGTSGMKVLVNGGLNISELDGWWAEAFMPQLGWALGDGREHADTAAWDRAEAEQLYELLENAVIPCFYTRDETGLPRQWIRRVRDSMARLTTRYSSNRMLREYTEDYYIPLAEACRRRAAGSAAGLQDWYRQLSRHWHRIHFGNVTSTPSAQEYQVEVQVYLDELP